MQEPKDTIVAVVHECTTRHAIRLRGILPDEQLAYYRDMIDGICDSVQDAVDTLLDAGANVLAYDTEGTQLEQHLCVDGAYTAEPLQHYNPPHQVTTTLLPPTPCVEFEPLSRPPFPTDGDVKVFRPWQGPPTNSTP